MDEKQFAPCPLCKQYSHSIGEDQLAEAFQHFQSMYAHPVRRHPMGHNFNEKTRDAAQALMAAARQASARNETLEEAAKLIDDRRLICDRDEAAKREAGQWELRARAQTQAAAFRDLSRIIRALKSTPPAKQPS